jgi:hypothetical protein
MPQWTLLSAYVLHKDVELILHVFSAWLCQVTYSDKPTLFLAIILEY